MDSFTTTLRNHAPGRSKLPTVPHRFAARRKHSCTNSYATWREPTIAVDAATSPALSRLTSATKAGSGPRFALSEVVSLVGFITAMFDAPLPIHTHETNQTSR